jgi:methylated-DNA-protein-cysteine methyltransferase related protein
MQAGRKNGRRGGRRHAKLGELLEKNVMSWDAVYTLVKKIPRGKVLTYGGVARAIKLKGGARAAGHAMAAMPKGQAIPWHRVVGSGGRLLIREPHASLQKKLLASEGTKITERRVDMKSSTWIVPALKRKLAKQKSAKQRPAAKRKAKVTARKRR